MTTSGDRTELGDAATRLAALGQRLTPQRRAVLSALRRARRTVTAPDLCEGLAESHPALGRATVFRTLDALVEAGLAQRFERPGHVYAYAACSLSDHHHHLLCIHCARTVEIDEAVIGPLVDELTTRYGFAVDHGSLDFYGVCQRCRPDVSTPASGGGRPLGAGSITREA